MAERKTDGICGICKIAIYSSQLELISISNQYFYVCPMCAQDARRNAIIAS